MYRRKSLALIIILLIVFAVACAKTAETPPLAIATNPPEPALPSKSASVATDDAWQRVQSAGKLVVGTSVDYPPFISYDANYRVDGFDAALMRKIAEKQNVKLVFKDVAFEGLADALSAGQIDAAIGAISITSEREKVVDFSQVYLVSADAVLAGAQSNVSIHSLDELAALRIGVEKGSVYEKFLNDILVATQKMPAEKLLAYTGMDQAYKDLASGQIDVIVLDLLPAQEAAKEGKGKIVAQELSRQAYGIAVKVGSASLQDAINQALDELQTEGTVAALAKQYLDMEILLPTPTPGVTPAVQPTPSGCMDSMSFVADLNLPDYGMKKPPQIITNTPFSKGWRIRNTGTCTWDSGYVLAYAGSSPINGYLTGQPVRITRPVPPGAETDISANMVAPAYPAVYMSFWTMRNKGGEAFGDRIYAGIQVVPPGPGPTDTPEPGITFYADKTSVGAGKPVTFSWRADGAKQVSFGLAGAAQPVSNPGGGVEAPLMPSTYELRVTYPNGSTKVRQIAVDVSIDPGGPYIIRFDVDPSAIFTGECTTLTWKIVNSVQRVTLLRNNDTLTDGAPTSSSYQDCPSEAGNYTYTLIAQGSGTTTKAQQGLSVTGLLPTDGPEPTWLPGPTDEPMPTWVPEPTEEPEPTWVPEPTDEPAPTWVPEPTDDPGPMPGPIDDGGDNG